MENKRYSKNRPQNYVPYKYEEHLSPFGRKVMAALFKLKDESNNKSCKSFYPQVQPSYQSKRVLEFAESSSSKSNISTNANIRNVDNAILPIIDNLPLISTCSDILSSPKDDSYLKEANIQVNSMENNSFDEFQKFHSSDSNTNNMQINENLVNFGFHKIFDINDIFCCFDDNNLNKSFEKQLDANELRLNSDVPEKKKKNNLNTDVNCNTESLVIPKKPIKRKNSGNVQCRKEKNNKVNDTICKKSSFRKEKSTTKVKRWLNNVHPKNKQKGDQNDEQLPSNVINACQSKIQKNKNVIQAQLANKDGIMKYCKPKNFVLNLEIENNKKESKDVTTESTAIQKSVLNKVVKEKYNRLKFIAPIKSQIPVKELEFPVNIINDHGEFEKIFNAVENEDIVINLIFSNGFCQLNSQHTDDACIPDAVLFNVQDIFYYLKGVDPCIMNAFCRLISTNVLVCYDAKMIFLYLYKKLEGAIKMSVIFDAKIGGSLIRPDEPPETFSDLQKLLSLTPDFTIATECVLQKTAWYTALLKESACKLKAMMVENDVYNLFVNIEMKILPIIAEMERKGICVNIAKLKSMEGVLMTRMMEIEAECHKAAGKNFQINSTLQVRTILYDELKLDTKSNIKIVETVSKRAKSTSEAMLRSLSDVHPLPRLILEYRHLHKARATFVTGIVQHVIDGVVKPTWDQAAAVTGRIASNGPNLQAIPATPYNLMQLPKEGETGKEESSKLKFRSVYSSRAGYCLLAADFKQLECRVFAHAARDRTLQDALLSRDLFTVLGAKWLCKSEDSVSSSDRSLTKRLVYASLYGAGTRTLAHVLQGTDRQLRGVIDSFNGHPTETFPSLKSFGKSVVSECESQGGRLTTLSGRTRTFKNIFSNDFALRSQAERRAVNFIIQGTAADLCKRAMVLVHEQLGPRGRLLLQLHDELVWEVQRHTLHAAAAIIKSAMESCGREFGLSLTLPVAMYCGDNWGEMEEFTLRDEESG